MGYHKSQVAILRVKSFLDVLVRSDQDVEFSVKADEEPSRVAYAIRNGIKASAAHNIKDYAELAGKFIIRVKPGKVIAELRNKIGTDLLKETIARMVVHNVTSIDAVVGAAIKYGNLDELYFPDITPTDESLKVMYNWTRKKGWKIIKNETGMTLTKREVEDGLVWGGSQEESGKSSSSVTSTDEQQKQP